MIYDIRNSFGASIMKCISEEFLKIFNNVFIDKRSKLENDHKDILSWKTPANQRIVLRKHVDRYK